MLSGNESSTIDVYSEIILFTACVQVSCVGQMVCAVVADTKLHARRGAAAVRIAYEDLPDPVFTIEVRRCFQCARSGVSSCSSAHPCLSSLRQDAIEKLSYFEPRRVIERGNVAEAFTNVDQIYEGGIK